MNYIPLSIPNFEGNEKKYVLDAVEQGWVSTGGAYITRLEKELAEYLHTDDVAACQSGTSAIHLALIDAGVESNDVVIVPTLTFIAAVNPVTYQHAIPVFMDCDDSLCMDADKLEKFCKEECSFENDKLYFKGNRVKAIVVVHIFGNMANMEHIMKVANMYNITVIEDATEAIGTYYLEGIYKGKYAGTIGDYGAYSFNGNKIITTGGGGAITSTNKESVNHIRFISTQSKSDSLYYIHDEIGYNYRMTNLQAALGVAQLELLPEFIRRKQVNYNLYKELIHSCDYIDILPFKENINSNKWFYSILIDIDKVNISLHDIITKLNEKNIQTRPIWGLIHEQKPYINCFAYDISKAKYYSERIINVPSSTQITKEEITYVCNTLINLLKEKDAYE